MKFYDAHNHLQDPALAPYLGDIMRDPPAAGMVVNGTGEDDWDAVAALAQEYPWVQSSYGVHPWRVDEATPAWRERLRERLDAGGHVGEIGLDRWKTEENFPRQLEFFRAQFAEAASRDVVATVHVLRAWGAFAEALRAAAPPARGWLLHAYGGPVEMVAGFAARGAYFSFSGSFLNPGRERKLAPFRVMPLDRLLVETDAPAMPLAPALERHLLPLAADGARLNHPANLAVAYAGLARLRGLPLEELAGIVAENYARLFGS